jgi:hypothetical protein
MQKQQKHGGSDPANHVISFHFIEKSSHNLGKQQTTTPQNLDLNLLVLSPILSRVDEYRAVTWTAIVQPR